MGSCGQKCTHAHIPTHIDARAHNTRKCTRAQTHAHTHTHTHTHTHACIRMSGHSYCWLQLLRSLRHSLVLQVCVCAQCISVYLYLSTDRYRQIETDIDRYRQLSAYPSISDLVCVCAQCISVYICLHPFLYRSSIQLLQVVTSHLSCLYCAVPSYTPPPYYAFPFL